MTGYTAYITYTRVGTPTRVIQVESRDEIVDVLHPSGKCEDRRDAEPVLNKAGWRIVQRPHPVDVQVFPVVRMQG